MLFPNEEEKIILKSKRKNPNPKKLNLKKFSNETFVDLIDNKEKNEKKSENPYSMEKEMFESKNKNFDFKENNSKNNFAIGQLQKSQILYKNPTLNKENSKSKNFNFQKNGCAKESPLIKVNKNDIQTQSQSHLKNYFNKLKSKKKELGKENISKINFENENENEKEEPQENRSSNDTNINYNIRKNFSEKKLEANYKSQNEFNTSNNFS